MVAGRLCTDGPSAVARALPVEPLEKPPQRRVAAAAKDAAPSEYARSVEKKKEGTYCLCVLCDILPVFPPAPFRPTHSHCVHVYAIHILRLLCDAFTVVLS